MPNWLTGLLIISAVGTGLSVLGKIMPRDKFAFLCIKWFTMLAAMLETLLLRFFPKKAEEELEEGVFCTISYGIRKGLELGFEARLRSDNEKHNPPPENKGLITEEDTKLFTHKNMVPQEPPSIPPEQKAHN